MKLRARSEVGLECSDGSVEVTRLVNFEQAGRVGTSSSVRGHEMRSPSITTSGEDILAAKLGGLSWQMHECWEKRIVKVCVLLDQSLGPSSLRNVSCHGRLGEIT